MTKRLPTKKTQPQKIYSESYLEALASAVITGRLFAPPVISLFERRYELLDNTVLALRMAVQDAGYEWPVTRKAKTELDEVVSLLDSPRTVYQLSRLLEARGECLSTARIRYLLSVAQSRLLVQRIPDTRPACYVKCSVKRVSQ